MLPVEEIKFRLPVEVAVNVSADWIVKLEFIPVVFHNDAAAPVMLRAPAAAEIFNAPADVCQVEAPAPVIFRAELLPEERANVSEAVIAAVVVVKSIESVSINVVCPKCPVTAYKSCHLFVADPRLY